MSEFFNPNGRTIDIPVEVEGPLGVMLGNFDLDTGASVTAIRPSMLWAVGYQPSEAIDEVNVIGVTGSARMSRFQVTRLMALGQEQSDAVVIAHELSAAAEIDGLLGLDFFRGRTLSIDFADGVVTLSTT